MIQGLLTIAIPESQKNEEWHKAYAQQILTGAGIGDGWFFESLRVWNNYKGIEDPEEYIPIARTSQGDALPVEIQSYNVVRNIIKNMLGELYAKPLNVNVSALSRHALSRKSEELFDRVVDFEMKPLAEQTFEATGIPLKAMQMPDDEKEFEVAQKNYKEKGELFYTRLLRDNMVRNRMGRVVSNSPRLQVSSFLANHFEEACVAGRTFWQVVNECGNVKVNDLDPYTVIFDPNCDSFLNGASYIGWVKYMSLPEASVQYGIPVEELQSLRTATGGMTGNTFVGASALTGAQFEIPYQYKRNGMDYILISHLEWKDTKRKRGEIDERDNKEFASLYDEEIPMYLPESKRKDIERKRSKAKFSKKVEYEIVRYCTMIANLKVIDYGIMENMVRHADDWTITGFSIGGYVDGWKYGTNVSLMQQVMPLQKTINEAWAKLRMALVRDRGKALIYDTYQVPKKYDLEYVTDYLPQLIGVIPINSHQQGYDTKFNQFPVVDRSLSLDNIRAYYEVIMRTTAQIREMLGYTPQRLGQVSPDAAVGATDMAVFTSTNSTRSLFEGFDISISQLLTTILGHLKIVVTEMPEKFTDIVGDDGVSYIETDIDHLLDDYGAYVSLVANDDKKKAVIDQAVSFALQNGQMSWVNAIRILGESDPAEALALIDRMEAEEQRAKKAQQAQEQQMAMQAQEQDAALKQQQMELQAQGPQLAAQSKIQAANVASDTAIETERMKQSALLAKQEMQSKNAKELKNADAVLQAMAARQQQRSKSQ